MHPNSLYLVLPVPFRLHGGVLHVESQAANGLDRWADHFDHVTVAAPVLPESQLPHLSGVVWTALTALEHTTRITPQPLPWAYTPTAFARTYRATRQLIAATIPTAQHLQFAIGGLWGDWAAVAALEAARQHRKYAIHTDRVEHELMRKTASGASPLRRAKIALEAPLMRRYHHHVIHHATLGLWHGDDCFRAYAPHCPGQNQLIHDIHTKPADLIAPAELAGKLASLATAQPLQLLYIGRLDPMKAPLEWLRALASARTAGVNFQATWYGEGPLRPQAEAEAARLGLTDVVRFPGFVADRAELLAHLRAAHALVFTHITPESPRNLLESLVSGTPILGYETPYPQDLLARHGGGALVPLHDTEALGGLIARAAHDRTYLAHLTATRSPKRHPLHRCRRLRGTQRPHPALRLSKPKQLGCLARASSPFATCPCSCFSMQMSPFAPRPFPIPTAPRSVPTWETNSRHRRPAEKSLGPPPQLAVSKELARRATQKCTFRPG